jgi:hypothetical protein
MYEYLSEAVVLKSEPRGDLDARVSVFTRRYGKLIGKAKSTRKITSKLVGHLQPGNLIKVRAVERGGLQIVDALKTDKLMVSVPDLHSLNELLAEFQPDESLWNLLAQGDFQWTEILRILGWDPSEGSCRICSRKPHSFRARDQEFFCQSCTLRLRPNEVILL